MVLENGMFSLTFTYFKLAKAALTELIIEDVIYLCPACKTESLSEMDGSGITACHRNALA